jgi:hypothetical protein
MLCFPEAFSMEQCCIHVLNTGKDKKGNLVYAHTLKGYRWTTGIVYRYYETNVMHFSFILFRIKGLYMFRALLAHPQEVLHKRQYVYFVRLMCHDCSETAIVTQPTDIIRTQYTYCRLWSASWG